MNKKTLYLIGGTIIGLFLLLIIGIWLYSTFHHKYFTYEQVLEKMKNATNEYYKINPEILPVNDGDQILPYSTLVENKLIKPLNELLVDGNECSAEIIVYKESDDYSYIPKLTCGDKFQTKELYKQILDNNEVVTSGSGLYLAEDGTYYFKGKIANNYIALGSTGSGKKYKDTLWKIISIKPDNTIEIKAVNTTLEKTSYDNRYNIDKDTDSGYNTFNDSILREYLIGLESNDVFLTPEQKKVLTKKQFCYSKRKLTDKVNDGSIECKDKSEPLLFGTIVPYEYIRASLDENCNKMEDKSCENYNYLVSEKIEWIITAYPENSYQSYVFNGKYFEKKTASTIRRIYPVTHINKYAMFVAGDGTETNPYRVFKKVTN